MLMQVDHAAENRQNPLRSACGNTLYHPITETKRQSCEQGQIWVDGDLVSMRQLYICY